jgi:toxoflavin biosynthesis protein ToxD
MVPLGERPPLSTVYHLGLSKGMLAQESVVYRLKMQAQLTPGLSGSPVLDARTGDAVAVAAIGHAGTPEGLAISIDALASVWPMGFGQLMRARFEHKGIEFIYVPGGSFLMGSHQTQSEELARACGSAEFRNEAPRTSVFVGGFYMSRFPITNSQYHSFVEATGQNVPYREDEMSGRFSWNPVTRKYKPGTENWPVVLVSWHNARDYSRWAGTELPSEAEWEKAARGSRDAREWPWGDDWDPKRANTIDGGRGTLAPIGTFSPDADSPFGVSDMSGNVWQWCNSLFAPYPFDAKDGRENPFSVGKRALRGGAWGNDKFLARCAARNCAPPQDLGFSIGFRVVLRKSPHLLQVNV